jgi:hypothetical protein
LLVVYSQNNLAVFQKIQGSWLLINKPESTNNTSSITIYKGSRALNFEYRLDGSKDYIGEYFIGFQQYNYNDVDSINVKNLKEIGMYYTEISANAIDKNGWAIKPDFKTPEIIEIDENTLWINYGNVAMFERIEKLPELALKLLYYRGKKDNRDYIKEYLDLEVKEIIKDKSLIYFEPGKVTNISLKKGDVVTVIEDKGEWLKVDYGTDNPGWIKREDAK